MKVNEHKINCTLEIPSSEELTTSAEELAGQAKQLKELMSFLTLETTEIMHRPKQYDQERCRSIVRMDWCTNYLEMDVCKERPLRILVVDDDVMIHMLIEITFRETCYTLEFAENGIKALTILREKSDFDLVFLDVDMPHMDGFEVCTAIRQIPGLNIIPVIFLTASDEPENMIKGFEVGAQDYVTKPFDSKELLARLDIHLQYKHKRESDKGEVTGT